LLRCAIPRPECALSVATTVARLERPGERCYAPCMQRERGHEGWRWGVIAAAALSGTLGLVASRTAQATCDSEPYGLLWSYPANGAQEVPVDADLFVNGQLNGLPSLDGEPLPRLASGVYDLGVLEPETRYEVRWEEAVIAFTTGTAAEFPALAPSSDVRVTRNPIDFARCPLVPRQGCFDTGTPARVRFDAGPARAWLVDVVSCSGSVRQMLWPNACGTPVVESEDRIVCARARSTQGAGFGESTGVICSVPDVSLDALPRTSDCQGAWPPEDALTVASNDAVTVGSHEAAAPAEPVAGCALAPAASGAGADIAGMAGAGLTALMLSRRRRARAVRSKGG
jgi:hypothetical protein